MKVVHEVVAIRIHEISIFGGPFGSSFRSRGPDTVACLVRRQIAVCTFVKTLPSIEMTLLYQIWFPVFRKPFAVFEISHQGHVLVPRDGITQKGDTNVPTVGQRGPRRIIDARIVLRIDLVHLALERLALQSQVPKVGQRSRTWIGNRRVVLDHHQSRTQTLLTQLTLQEHIKACRESEAQDTKSSE